jgi:hypothetical protein
MIRLATLFWVLLVAATGAAMFTVKYQVQGLDAQLSETRKAQSQEQHEIRMLTAEWAYLNRPDALSEMNRRYLSLVPIATRQLQVAIADLPMRAPPAPGGDVAVAAAGPAPSPSARPAVVPTAAPIPAVAAASPAHIVPIPPARRPDKTLDALFARILASR